jgi:DNA ligase-1
VGRSHTLLKVKTFFDAEGRVVGHEEGKGKHKGRLGALVVEMDNGTRFNVGTGLSDKERQDPPAIGAIITYRYQELSKDGVPRFPSYVGLAIDKAAPTPAPTPKLATTKPSPTAATAAPTATTTTTMLVMGEGEGDLFWEVTLQGAKHTVRFGRVGAKGQSRDKVFVTEALAAEHAQRLIELMMDAGYRLP